MRRQRFHLGRKCIALPRVQNGCILNIEGFFSWSGCVQTDEHLEDVVLHGIDRNFRFDTFTWDFVLRIEEDYTRLSARAENFDGNKWTLLGKRAWNCSARDVGLHRYQFDPGACGLIEELNAWFAVGYELYIRSPFVDVEQWVIDAAVAAFGAYLEENVDYFEGAPEFI